MYRLAREAPNTRWHCKRARAALDLVRKHQTVPERVGACDERKRIHRRARRWVDPGVRRDRLKDVGDLRTHDVRWELDPDRETRVLPKARCEDVEECGERWAGGVVSGGRARGDVGATRVEFDGDAGGPVGMGCAEALDSVEHQTEVGRVGFGDADDEGLGCGGRALEDGADPTGGTDVVEDGVRGVAV